GCAAEPAAPGVGTACAVCCADARTDESVRTKPASAARAILTGAFVVDVSGIALKVPFRYLVAVGRKGLERRPERRGETQTDTRAWLGCGSRGAKPVSNRGRLSL